MRIASFQSAESHNTLYINIQKIVGFERMLDDGVTLIFCDDHTFEVVETPEQIIQTLAGLSN